MDEIKLITIDHNLNKKTTINVPKIQKKKMQFINFTFNQLIKQNFNIHPLELTNYFNKQLITYNN